MDADGLLLVVALCEDDIEGDSNGGGKERGISCHIDSTCFATTLRRDLSLQIFLLLSKDVHIDFNHLFFLKTLVFSLSVLTSPMQLSYLNPYILFSQTPGINPKYHQNQINSNQLIPLCDFF